MYSMWGELFWRVFADQIVHAEELLERLRLSSVMLWQPAPGTAQREDGRGIVLTGRRGKMARTALDSTTEELTSL